MAPPAADHTVATVIRDDFFNDPFFKDWWADFDLPLKSVQFNRQTSGEYENLQNRSSKSKFC